ncbi:MAG TPA: hypothetical protein VI072_04725 [Polyangiaceae bacterium]
MSKPPTAEDVQDDLALFPLMSREARITTLISILTRRPANDVPHFVTLQDGRTFEGSPLEIVTAMRARCFVQNSSLRDYMDWLVDNTSLWGITLVVTGETDAERAASIVDELLRTGLGQRGKVYSSAAVIRRARTWAH